MTWEVWGLHSWGSRVRPFLQHKQQCDLRSLLYFKPTLLILKKIEYAYEITLLSVCVCPLIVAMQRLSKNSLIIARQRLGKNPLIVTMQRFSKNPFTVARQRLGRNVTVVTNTQATTE
jgi:hypothetical protein